jgi:hypothetical protein
MDNKIFNGYPEWHEKIIKCLGCEFAGVVNMNCLDYMI